tara:strand:- start:152 stop:733 length:582 start_codon:yes stop_codon:yes gene_type:complete
MIYPATEKYIELAKNALLEGQIIVYPTDTLYGFGVDATNSEAIKRLNRLKGRVQPLSIIIDSIKSITNYVKLDHSIKSDVYKLFPGVYTVLLPALSSNLSPLIQSSSLNVGIRIPNHFFPINLVKLLKRPIVTTSINRHGNESINDVTQVEIDFPNIDIYEDNNHKKSIGSTIIDYSLNPPEIIRLGDGPFPL